MLHTALSPASAYRRIELDAQVEGSDGGGLGRFCLEQAVMTLEKAIAADRRRDVAARADALSRAAGLILALRRGIAPDNPLRPALLTFLGAAAAEIGSAVARFEEGRMRALRDDLHDVLAAAHPH